MANVIYPNLAPLAGLLFLIFSIKTNHLFNKQQSRFFLFAAIINIIIILSTATDFLFSLYSVEYAWIIRRITSFLSFALAPMIPLFLLLIFRHKKTSFLLYIPSVINIVVCFISMFANIVYFIGKNNTYSRGPLFYISVITSFLYLLLIFVIPDDLHRRGAKAERFFLFAVLVVIGIALMFEIVFRYTCILYGCTAICLISFYILKNTHYFMIDPLTGAFNRQMYTQALAQIDHSKSCFLCLLDINEFKYINDTYGHEAGDKALILFVDILHRNLKNIAVFYRIGGDEFALLSKKIDANALNEALNQAQAEANRNHLRFAYGITLYNAGDDLQEALRLADKAMYQNKNSMKSKQLTHEDGTA